MGPYEAQSGRTKSRTAYGSSVYPPTTAANLLRLLSTHLAKAPIVTSILQTRHSALGEILPTAVVMRCGNPWPGIPVKQFSALCGSRRLRTPDCRR